MIKNFVLLAVTACSVVVSAEEQVQQIVAKAGEKIVARISSGPAKSIVVKDVAKAKACDKTLEAPVMTAVCGKEIKVSFLAHADCDEIKSVSQKKGFTKIRMKSGKQVELRETCGTVEVDYDN